MTLTPDFSLVKLCEKHEIPRVYQRAGLINGKKTYQLVCRECRRERYRDNTLTKYGSWYGKKLADKKRHPEKFKAWQAVSDSVRSGELTRGQCEKCGCAENIHAHHEDYSKPLEVVWLCSPCHHLTHLKDGIAA